MVYELCRPFQRIYDEDSRDSSIYIRLGIRDTQIRKMLRIAYLIRDTQLFEYIFFYRERTTLMLGGVQWFF